MSDVNTWNVAAASNNAAAPNGFPEGMPPSGVNDAAREVMAAVARYREDTDGVNTSSGTDTITLASSRTMTAYAQGDLYTFKAGGTNTGATTLNVDGLGAKDVQFNGAACTGGEIITDLMYTVVYDGTQFQLMNAASYPAIDIETLEVTNIKAKDGTASATIANSTGLMTLSKVQINDGRALFKLSSPGSNAALNVTGLNALGNSNTPIGVNVGFEIASESTQGAVGFQSTADLQDAAFTLQYYSGFAAADLYCDSTTPIVTTQYGFKVNDLTYATTNYGFYSDITASGTSRYNFYANGTAPNYFGGNTIVSVADDTNAALRVTQTGTGNALLIEDSSNPDSTPLVVNSVGDVITGSTVSYDGCAVHGTNPAAKFQMHGYLSGDVNINAFCWDSTNVYAGGYVGLKSASDAIGTHTAVSDGDRMVGFVGAGSDGTNFVRSAWIAMDVDGTVATDSVPSSIKFYTNGVGDTSNTLRLKIENDGRINSQGGRIGYGFGGSSVTQTTSRTTGVTINACSGKITLVSAAGSTTYATFTVTNSQVAADTTVIVNQRSGTNKYKTHVTAVAAGSFDISFATTSGTATDSPVFNFALIQASDT
jgi:hypothetical protein